jgi:drug/metabolite transporter (DMT)-like permease
VILGSQRRLRLPGREDLAIILSWGCSRCAGIVIRTWRWRSCRLAVRARVYDTAVVAVLLALAFRISGALSWWAGAGLAGSPCCCAGIGGLERQADLGLTSPARQRVLWATIHIRRHHWTRTPLDLSLAAAGSAAAGAVRRSRWTGGRASVGPATVLILLYSGVLATAFATWAAQSITRSLGAQASATGYLAIPVVGLVSGALILGEQLGPLDVAGFALVLGGVAAASLVSAPGLRRDRGS